MAELPIVLLQGQKASRQTQYVEALQVNVSPIASKVFGADGWMQQEPGLTQYGTGEGIDRGGVWNDNFQMLFRVSGNSLVSVGVAGATTILGNSTAGLIGQQASMPYSFNTQMIVVDGKAYLYDPINGVQIISDPDIGVPIDCVWVDGYYVFTDGDYLYHTDLDDEYAINPLKYATAEFSPDRTKGVGLTTDNKLIDFGRFTIEFFANEANEFFAFTRISSRTVQYGIIDTHCKAQYGGLWAFMGGSSESSISIYLLDVGTAQNISCRAVDAVIAKYTEADLVNSLLEVRVINNYVYLIVQLPNETLMLNKTALQAFGPDIAWCILQSGVDYPAPYRAIHGVYDPRRPDGKQWTYGDRISNKIGYLNFNVATHYDNIIECVLYTPFMYLEGASIDELMIQTIPGFTTVDDATVFFSITYNGVTWGMECSIGYGGPSSYGQRFIAFALGYISNFFSFKFRWTSRSRMAFSAGLINYG